MYGRSILNKKWHMKLHSTISEETFGGCICYKAKKCVIALQKLFEESLEVFGDATDCLRQVNIVTEAFPADAYMNNIG